MKYELFHADVGIIVQLRQLMTEDFQCCELLHFLKVNMCQLAFNEMRFQLFINCSI